MADTGRLHWFQLKPPLKICMHHIQLTSGWAGDTYLVTVHIYGEREGVQKVAEYGQANV